jgi:hypothetical protein
MYLQKVKSRKAFPIIKKLVFCWVFRVLGPDPDPEACIRADPDPQENVMDLEHSSLITDRSAMCSAIFSGVTLYQDSSSSWIPSSYREKSRYRWAQY